MKRFRAALILSALAFAGAGCAPVDPPAPGVEVSVTLVGPADDPTGVLVSAVPSGFPGSGPYGVSFGVADEYAGSDALTGDSLPAVVPIDDLQIVTDAEGGRSVQVRAEATYQRGGASATGVVSKLLCWIRCAR